MTEPLSLEYNLAELPSSQHRAGLAGLVLMVQWHNDNQDKRGVCEITHLSEMGATLEIDQEGLQSLFDKVYGFFWKTIETDKKPKGNDIAFTTEERDGKTFYIYDILQPQGAFLGDYDPTFENNDGIWIRLWREMLFKVIRADHNPKLPFKNRADGLEDKTATEVWQNFQKPPKNGLSISHPLFLTAQGKNAEDVPFKDLAKFQFLLHFWVFVAQVYVPTIHKYDKDKKKEVPEDVGFALAIPDIANLEIFCEELPRVLQQREVIPSGYRPKESIIDMPAEGALEMMSKINDRMAKSINFQISDLLLGVDVIHLEKKKNNVRLWGNSRIDPIREMIDEYSRVKTRFANALFRRQRILNVLNSEREWFDGFDSLLSKTDSEQTINSPFFRSDVRKAFEEIGVETNSKGGKIMDADIGENAPKTIESVVYQLVRTYIYSKLDSKYQLSWSKVKGTPEEKKYNEMKGKIAREAFLAVRSRTDSDFTEYFASTLCSYHQFSLNGDGFDLVAKALRDDNEKLRTLTMLALSANGYSQRENQEKS